MSATSVVHFVHVQVFTSSNCRELVEHLSWVDLPWHTRMRFDWYFKYRRALLQVKYPKHHTVMKWGHYEPEGDQGLRILRNRIIAKKGKLTEVRNKLQKAIDHWDQLFPIEDDLLYKNAVAKIERIENELKELQIQYDGKKERNT